VVLKKLFLALLCVVLAKQVMLPKAVPQPNPETSLPGIGIIGGNDSYHEQIVLWNQRHSEENS